MKKYQFTQILAAFVASIGSFIFGILLGWSAPAVLKLVQNPQLNLSSLDVAWIVSIVSLGSLACVPAGMIRNRYGSRILMVLYSSSNIIGWLLLAYAFNSWMLILGRFLCGIAGGGFMFLAPIYIGEISSKDIRGRLASFVEVNMKFGVLFMYIIGSLMSYHQANIICGVVSVLFMIIAYFLPESPVYLLKKGKVEEARKSLKLFRETNENFDEELNDLKHSQLDKDASFFMELKVEATRKAFIIIVVLFVMFQISGVNAILFYSTQIMIDSGMNFDPFLSTILLGFVQIFSVLLAMALIDQKGRKFLLLYSFIIMTLGNLFNSAYFHFKAINFEMSNLTLMPLIGVIIYLIGFNSGIGTVTFVLMSEIFSTSAKKVIAPLALTGTFLSSFLVTLAFPLISAHVGMHLMFYFFAFSCIVGFIFTWKFIPETKGKSLSEIQKLLSKPKEIYDMNLNEEILLHNNPTK